MLVGGAFHLGPVGLFLAVAGFGNARLQPAVVGQQQQALAVGVQSTGGIETRGVDVVLEAGMGLVRAELADDAAGFVEGDEGAGRGHGKGASRRAKIA